MQRAFIISASALLLAVPGESREFLPGPGESFDAAESSRDAGTVTITQSSFPGSFFESVACAVDGSHTVDNAYLRRFLLIDDHGIVDPFVVLGIEFGVAQLEFVSGALDVDVPFTVNLYSIDAADPLVYGNVVLRASVAGTTNSGDLGTLLDVAISAEVDPSTEDLVVELVTPTGEFGVDGTGADPYQFRPGVTDSAIRDSFLQTVDCAVIEPLEISLLGFPDNQFLLFVTGFEDGIEPPVPTRGVTWSAVKSLF